MYVWCCNTILYIKHLYFTISIKYSKEKDRKVTIATFYEQQFEYR